MSSPHQTQSYPLGHGHYSAARLNLQHYLWKSTYGYLIHPTIPSIRPGAKIADIGTGTGIWLLDLHESLPSELDVRLDGLDVDLSQSPHSAWLPSRVSMRRFDVYDELPSDLVEKYDVVNVRFFLCVVRDGDPSPLLSLFVKMLKPGGWLQWTEMDIRTLKVQAAAGVENTEHTQTLRDFAIAPTPDWPVEKQYWTSSLVDIMSEHGFTNAIEDRRAKASWQQPHFHDVTLLAMDEMVGKLPEKSAAEKIHNATKEFEESNRGLTIVGESVCVIARKA